MRRTRARSSRNCVRLLRRRSRRGYWRASSSSRRRCAEPSLSQAQAEQQLRDDAAEFERQKREWLDDRERLLKRIRELEEENAMLKARLQEEMNHKFNYAQQVRE